jgi:asparagine synthase (glutamine-hydrolysing)
LRINYVSTDDVERGIDDIASIYDEPFGNSSAVPALVCARIAKSDGIDHLLAGDGGDELFAGNTRYAKQRIFELYAHLPTPLRSLAEGMLLDSPLLAKTPLRKVQSYIQQARIPLPDRFESYNFLLRETMAAIFEPEFLRRVDPEHPFSAMREPYNRIRGAATLDRMLYLDWKFTLADNDLRKVVATCNNAGVAVSFPWLDDRVVEFSTRMPADWKMRGTKLRYFAKDALKNFLPTATITKSKHGFGLPFGQWLKTSPTLQERVYHLLGELKHRGIFQPVFLDRLVAEHRSGHAAYYGTMVWVLAMLEAWFERNDFST